MYTQKATVKGSPEIPRALTREDVQAARKLQVQYWKEGVDDLIADHGNFEFLINQVSTNVEGIALKKLPGYKSEENAKKKKPNAHISIGKEWTKAAKGEMLKAVKEKGGGLKKAAKNQISGILYYGIYRYGMVQMLVSGL